MLRVAKTEYGVVRGLPADDPRVTVYKGIPFAKPPVGDLRWKKPVPCDKWDGEYEAYKFGPISVQDTPALGTDIYCREWHVDSEIPMSEDCLYLNIWTPAKATTDKLPVLVWYFGGAFQWGYTPEMEFNGERLARRDIIVVSVGYRLGAFGFMAHPELSKEDPKAPSNFGLLDQRMGLKWVYDNIEAFGGDKKKITIAGQSAGGGSVQYSLTDKENYEMINNAVIFSGMIHNNYAPDPVITPHPLCEMEELGEQFLEFLGVSSIEEARGLDAIFIRDKYAEFAQNHLRFVPNIDGVRWTKEPYKALCEGDCADVPVMAGYTKDEFPIPYPTENENDPKVYMNMVFDGVFGAFNAHDKINKKTKWYAYRFAPSIPGWDNPGDFHSVDLWFFFETLMKCWRPFNGKHYELAEKMANYFANFVKSGNPNGDNFDGTPMPLWPAYDSSNPCELTFEDEGPTAYFFNAQAVNPYLPSWEYIPDGEPYVFRDRVYVYGSHDFYNENVFCPGDYVSYSANINNLGYWRYEGVTYPRCADPLNKDGKMCLYAPDVVVGPDGRYYLYYCLDKVPVVSVAVCDTPSGNFEFYGYVHYKDGTKLGEKAGDEPQFDPAVLLENDKVYLFTGFCGFGDKSRHGAQRTVLDKDMLTIIKEPEIIVPGCEYSEGSGFEGHAFFEASSIRYREGIYYFIYSSQVMHELCYAYSDSIDGKFTYGGVIISNADIGIDSYKKADMPIAFAANNHGSIVEIGDDWYIFYHRHTNGTWYSRQGCAEKIHFDDKGMIAQVEVTSCGLNGGPLSDKEKYNAYIACNLIEPDMKLYEAMKMSVKQEGADTSHLPAYVGGIHKGCIIGFKYFDYSKVTGLGITARGYAKGEFEIMTSLDGKSLGTVSIDFTNVWTDYTTGVNIPDGAAPLYLKYTGDGMCDIRSIWFEH